LDNLPFIPKFEYMTGYTICNDEQHRKKIKTVIEVKEDVGRNYGGARRTRNLLHSLV